MSGKGKYTTYAPPQSDKNTLLNKLFKSNDAKLVPPTQDLVGKENDARAAIVNIAKAVLQPALQTGDPGHFPQGVALDFSGIPGDTTNRPPDTAEGKDVKWDGAGDPANSYVPDITSPGPGKTDGLDKATDPQIKVADIKPNHVVGANTKSPTATTNKIVTANVLGTDGKLGDSGANS